LKALEAERPVVAVVVGAAGQPEYGKAFQSWADRWEEAASAAGASFVAIGRAGEGDLSDREQLKEFLAAHEAPGGGPLWLVLIGHGTHFRETAKFNLRGADVSSKELADWLKGVKRPLAVINCSSSSGAFLADLKAPGRVIVTATQSGAEQNYSRFGEYLSKSIHDVAADLDHDKQVSLLEAFLSASGQVAQFYEDDARLATEHALLDDNADGLGTPATFFRGVRAAREAKDDAPLDGSLAARTILVPGDVDRGFSAAQLARRQEIEAQIDRLRGLKTALDDELYYKQLQPWLVELAKLYEEVELGTESTEGTDVANLDGLPPGHGLDTMPPSPALEGLPPSPVD
jgi:hypothetical protein